MIHRFKIENLFNRSNAGIFPVSAFCEPGKVWCAGGALRSLINTNEPIADYDMFFSDVVYAEKLHNTLTVAGWKCVFSCPKKELYTFKRKGIKVQLITKRFYSNVEELLYSFDFSVCMAAFDGDTVFMHRSFIKDVRKKNLSINDVTYPVATINRLFKYKNKGYNIKESTLVDLVRSISSRQFDGDQLQLYID